MANYQTLKSAIQQVVKTNGNNKITGALLQQSLLLMINSLGAGYQFVGVATPSTNPGTPDQKVFYIASVAGTYSNFGGLVVNDGELAILKFDGEWSKNILLSLDVINTSIGLEEYDNNVSYQRGSVIFIKEFSPNKEINKDCEVIVRTQRTDTPSVTATVIRNGNTQYLSFTRKGNEYYLQLLSGDIIVNIYYSYLGEIGDNVDILFSYNNGVNLLINKVAADAEKFKTLEQEILPNEQTYEAYQRGNLLFLTEFDPIKVFFSSSVLNVKKVSSSVSSIAITLIRGGSTQYLSIPKIAEDEWEIRLAEGDQLKNIYFAQDGNSGDELKVSIFSYSTIKVAVDNLRLISNKEDIQWIAMGDSLTDPSTLGSTVKNYVNYVAQRLRITAINKGSSGSGYWKRHTDGHAFYQLVPTFTENADIITIFGSFNDLGNEGGVAGSSIIGTYLDNTESTVAGCINKTIDALIEQYPNSIIGLIAPTPWEYSHTHEYYETYVSVLQQIAEYRSIPFLDLFHSSNLRPWDDDFKEEYYLNADGVHPNTNGHKRFSGIMMQFINSLLYK